MERREVMKRWTLINSNNTSGPGASPTVGFENATAHPRTMMVPVPSSITNVNVSSANVMVVNNYGYVVVSGVECAVAAAAVAGEDGGRRGKDKMESNKTSGTPPPVGFPNPTTHPRTMGVSSSITNVNMMVVNNYGSVVANGRCATSANRNRVSATLEQNTEDKKDEEGGTPNKDKKRKMISLTDDE